MLILWVISIWHFFIIFINSPSSTTSLEERRSEGVRSPRGALRGGPLHGQGLSLGKDAQPDQW